MLRIKPRLVLVHMSAIVTTFNKGAVMMVFSFSLVIHARVCGMNPAPLCVNLGLHRWHAEGVGDILRGPAGWQCFRGMGRVIKCDAVFGKSERPPASKAEDLEGSSFFGAKALEWIGNTGI